MPAVLCCGIAIVAGWLMFAYCHSVQGMLTVLHCVFRKVLHIAAPLDVLPDLQVGASWVDEVCDDLIVDLQHAALTAEGQVLMALQNQGQQGDSRQHVRDTTTAATSAGSLELCSRALLCCWSRGQHGKFHAAAGSQHDPERVHGALCCPKADPR